MIDSLINYCVSRGRARTIFGPDGAPYLMRFTVFKLAIFGFKLASLHVHRFMRPDYDPYPHTPVVARGLAGGAWWVRRGAVSEGRAGPPLAHGEGASDQHHHAADLPSGRLAHRRRALLAVPHLGPEQRPLVFPGPQRGDDPLA